MEPHVDRAAPRPRVRSLELRSATAQAATPARVAVYYTASADLDPRQAALFAAQLTRELGKLEGVRAHLIDTSTLG